VHLPRKCLSLCGPILPTLAFSIHRVNFSQATRILYSPRFDLKRGVSAAESILLLSLFVNLLLVNKNNGVYTLIM